MRAVDVWRGTAQMLTGVLIGGALAASVVGTAVLTDRESAPVSVPKTVTLSDPKTTPGDTDETIRPLIEEDDPRWNCHTDGNRICGENVDGLTLLSAYLRSSGTVLS